MKRAGQGGLQSAALRQHAALASSRVIIHTQSAIEERPVEYRHGPHLSQMSDRDYHVQIIQHLTAQLRAEPDNRRAHFLRGNAYLDNGYYQAAIDDYSRAIDLQPDAVAYNNRGIAYRNLKDPQRAIADYRQALMLDIDYRDAYNNLGLVLSDQNAFEEAIRCFNRAIDLDPNYWYAYNHRATALWALGRREEARRDYETVRNLLNPTNT